MACVTLEWERDGRRMRDSQPTRNCFMGKSRFLDGMVGMVFPRLSGENHSVEMVQTGLLPYSQSACTPHLGKNQRN